MSSEVVSNIAGDHVDYENEDEEMVVDDMLCE